MRASLIIMTGGGGGVASSAEYEIRRMHALVMGNRLRKNIKKDTGQQLRGLIFIGKTS